jgi:hypothetical protein
MTVESLTPFFYALLMGGAYAGVWFILKVVDKTKPETLKDFDTPSFAVTVCFGAAIGVLNVLAQSPITQLGIETQLLAYGTEIAVAREIVLAGYNWIRVFLETRKVV